MTFSGQQPVRPQADWLQQLTDIRQLMAEQAAELDRSGDFPTTISRTCISAVF